MDTALLQGTTKWRNGEGGVKGQGRIPTCGAVASSPGLRGGSITSETREGNVFFMYRYEEFDVRQCAAVCGCKGNEPGRGG